MGNSCEAAFKGGTFDHPAQIQFFSFNFFAIFILYLLCFLSTLPDWTEFFLSFSPRRWMEYTRS